MHPLKLIISKINSTTWSKTVIDLTDNNVIFEYSGISLFDESEAYFDRVVSNAKLCYPNITEVERFI